MSVKNNILDGTGAVLADIKYHHIQPDSTRSVTQQNVSHLISYNLLPKNRKTIIVPGSPPTWSPKPLPLHIPADKGVHTMDPVRDIFPTAPLEPLFRALDSSCPTFSPKNIDLITDRRHLRLLLAYAGGSKKEFRIDAEIVGGTVLFSVWMVFKTCYVDGSSKSGYGRNFEKLFTKAPEEAERSITHNRAVEYSLGGIRILLRYEVDACVSIPGIQSQQQQQQPDRSTTTPTGFRVLSRGSLVASDRIAEIKTTRVGKNLATSNNIAQLWFSCTPMLLMGYHRGEGTFSELAETNVRATGKLDQWEKSNTQRLQRMVKVLEMILQILRGLKKRKCAIILKKGMEDLQVYELDEGKYTFGLPDDIKAKWD
ncbi:hypothetical protein BDD12DRAFT_897046 [Trichophaea hybrida]|nr:hypothetical protein BDD12DRAFT_897046 [Trichophaea hybrida]